MSTEAPKILSAWKSVLICLILAVFLDIIFFRLPATVGLAFRYDYFVIPILLATLYVTCVYYPARLGSILCLNLIIWTCLLPLSGLWQSGLSDSMIIGGLLPFSDASSYYADALRLLDGGHFSYFTARRPLFSGMLASILRLTSRDIRLSLVIIVALTAVCFYFAIREVQLDHGYAAGFLMFLLLFLFYRRFIGTTLTENLGLALGSLGFVALWRSAKQLNRGYGFLGLFLLTTALCARAGAFFVLPAVIIWGMWVFRGEKRFSSTFLLGGIGSVAAGFALDAVLRHAISPGGARLGFENFSWSLYGILAGGDWKLVWTQHPEIHKLAEPELSQRIYALALDMLRQHPSRLFYGIIRGWKQALWFPKPTYSLLGFIIIMNPQTETIRNLIHSDGIGRVLQLYPYQSINHLSLAVIFLIIQGLGVIGFLSLLRRNRDSRDLLMIAVAIGIFFSLPFARVADADSMRAYAATIPFIALVPVLGLGWIMVKIGGGQDIAKINNKASWLPLTLLAAVLIALSTIGPLAIRAFAKNNTVPTARSDNGLVARCIWFSPGSSIYLTPDNNANGISRYNVLPVRDFKAGLTLFQQQYPHLAEVFRSLKASTTITFTPCLGSTDNYFFIFDHTMAKIPAGPVMLYGKVSKTRKFFRVEEVDPLM